MSTFENAIAVLHPIEAGNTSKAITSSLPWYAIQVRCHAEKNVSLMLEARGFEQYLPLYSESSHWSDRVKKLEHPLFPGYVFCRLDVPHRRPVVTVPGVISIVGFGNTFAPIPDEQISAIQCIVRSGLPSGPCPFLQEGERIRITAGALEGVEGILVRIKNEFRVVVSVALLQRSVAVEIERSWIEPQRSQRPC